MKKNLPAIARCSASTLLAFACCGCSLFAPKQETIKVSSVPSDATVIVSGKVGRTPAVFDVPCGEHITILVEKDGYHQYKEILGHRLGVCGTLDLIGGIFVGFPLLGLLSTNGSNTLEKNDVVAVLQQKAAAQVAPAPVAAPAAPVPAAAPAAATK
ncbi:MAG: PEGA domain-containing protein [Victivallaceae bacterium]|nr:PEGA domain-containing protein [Victivallaceae bacterium]